MVLTRGFGTKKRGVGEHSFRGSSRDAIVQEETSNGTSAIRISYLIRIRKIEQKSVENYTSRCFEKFSKTQGGKKVKKVFWTRQIMKQFKKFENKGFLIS